MTDNEFYDLIDAKEQAAEAACRSRLVAWLRGVAAAMKHSGDLASGRIQEIADAIERGEAG